MKSATITPTALADVAVTKTVSNAAPNLGTNVTFTVTEAPGAIVLPAAGTPVAPKGASALIA